MASLKLYLLLVTIVALLNTQNHLAAAQDRDYAANCTTEQCQDPFVCIPDDSSVVKCFCPDGSYESQQQCINFTSTNIGPTFANTSSTTDNVSIAWNANSIEDYEDSYIIKYSIEGGSQVTTPDLGDITGTTIDGLSPGTVYIFVVSRSISRNGRTQRNIDSVEIQISTKAEYGGNCTQTAQCQEGFSCIEVESNNKCLCADGSYLNIGNCVSSDDLRPSIGELILTLNGVFLNWTSRPAADYDNDYVVNYTAKDGNEQTTNNLGNLLEITIEDLQPGTSYIFIVTRYISRHGRTQPVADSDGRTIITNGAYGDRCLPSMQQCRDGLACIPFVNKCLCADGSYFVDGLCSSTAALKATITDITSTHNAVELNWNSSAAVNYTSSYIIKYTPAEGPQKTTPDLGDITGTTIADLKSGTTYTFIVSRTITREDRNQTNIDSDQEVETTKIEYGQACINNGTCKENNTDCFLGQCRCNKGLFRNTHINICQNNEILKPINVSAQGISTTQVDVSWTAPSDTTVVTGYGLDVSPGIPPGGTNITGTSATLSSLTPGQKYNITVRTKINYFNRSESVEAGQVSQTTVPTKTRGRSPAANLTAPDIQIWFYKADGVAQSYEVRLQGMSPDPYNVTRQVGQTGDTILAEFSNIIPGQKYFLNIVTNSYGLFSDPFTETIQAKAEQAGKVEQLTANSTFVNSRSILVTWKRPQHPNGNIFQYIQESYSYTGCVQRVIINCTQCKRGAKDTDNMPSSSCVKTNTYIVSEEDIGNDEYILTHNVTHLLPDTNYTLVVAAYNEYGQGMTDSRSRHTLSEETDTNILPIIVGVTVPVVLVIIVVIAVILFLRRSKDEEPVIQRKRSKEEEPVIQRKRPIKINEFERRVEEMHRDTNLLFAGEFEDIGDLSPKHSCLSSETAGNKPKNRYSDIMPFDQTRVKLMPIEDETDYINANYIPGYRSSEEYIATQGPMTDTVNDFWRLIWEQNVPIIVMLSDLMEKGQPKVDRYYPENKKPVKYGKFIVEMTHFLSQSKYVIRIFKIQLGDEVRNVKHYFLPGWQDFDANLTSDDVINFFKRVRMEIKPNTQEPMCIHCSAGVGRTGTYIALDVFQQHIDEEIMKKELDIFDFVLRMRQNRCHMVQSEKQYIFIHDTIKEMIIRKKTEMSERNQMHQNHHADDNVYQNQAFDHKEVDPGDIYMNEDSSGPSNTVV